MAKEIYWDFSLTLHVVSPLSGLPSHLLHIMMLVENINAFVCSEPSSQKCIYESPLHFWWCEPYYFNWVKASRSTTKKMKEEWKIRESNQLIMDDDMMRKCCFIRDAHIIQCFTQSTHIAHAINPSHMNKYNAYCAQDWYYPFSSIFIKEIEGDPCIILKLTWEGMLLLEAFTCNIAQLECYYHRHHQCICVHLTWLW